LILLTLKLDFDLDVAYLSVFIPLIIASGLATLLCTVMAFALISKIRRHQVLLFILTPVFFTVFLILMLLHMDTISLKMTWVFLPLELFITFFSFLVYSGVTLWCYSQILVVQLTKSSLSRTSNGFINFKGSFVQIVAQDFVYLIYVIIKQIMH